jgi:hypothetical protein
MSQFGTLLIIAMCAVKTRSLQVSLMDKTQTCNWKAADTYTWQQAEEAKADIPKASAGLYITN